MRAIFIKQFCYASMCIAGCIGCGMANAPWLAFFCFLYGCHCLADS